MARPSLQRIVKVVHVISAGVWLGALLAIAAVQLAVATGRGAFGQQLAIYLVHDQLVFWAFVVTLVTGLVFSLFTPWGFARHWWIAVKWALALLLFGVTMFVQAPVVSGAVALADAGVDQVNGLWLADFQRRSATVALIQVAIVLAVFAISTLKPWGRIRRKFDVSRRWLIGGIVTAGALGVAFAIFNAVQLHGYRTMAIDGRSAAGLPDGTYRGRARCGADYAVEVDLRAGHIDALRVLENRTSHYARIAEATLPRIVAAQRADVDAITGATTSSRCLMHATAEALAAARAGGDGRAVRAPAP